MDPDRVWRFVAEARGRARSTIPTSPAGDKVVFTKGQPDSDLFELSTSEGPIRTVLATTGKESNPVWSPDGDLLAYVTDRNGRDEIWVRNRVGQPLDRPLITQRDFVDAANIMLASPSFSPNGQGIICGLAAIRSSPCRSSRLPLQARRLSGSCPKRTRVISSSRLKADRVSSPDISRSDS